MPPIIDLALLESIIKSNNFTRAGNIATLLHQITALGIKTYDFLSSCSAKEMAGMSTSMNNFYSKSKKRSKSAYPEGTIVMTDLGLGYGYELAFKHPAVVLHDDNELTLIVVPCSSGKFGKGWPIVDGDTTDGFARNTGCAIDSVRSIQKVRIYQSLGRVTPAFLNKLRVSYLIWYNPEMIYLLGIETETVDMLLEEKKQERYYFDLLKNELDASHRKMENLENENQELKQNIKMLEQKLTTQ